jgi:hypothetical protein
MFINGSLSYDWQNVYISDPAATGRLLDGMNLYHTADTPAAGDHSWLEREWYVSGLAAA